LLSFIHTYHIPLHFRGVKLWNSLILQNRVTCSVSVMSVCNIPKKGWKHQGTRRWSEGWRVNINITCSEWSKFSVCYWMQCYLYKRNTLGATEKVSFREVVYGTKYREQDLKSHPV
jgi:hypothetical protein